MTTTLYLGDCLDVLRTLPDASVDAVIADPPYGTTACKWDSVIPLAAMWEQLRRVTKRNAAIVLFAAQPFTSALVMSNPKEFKYEWIWNKSHSSGFLAARYRPLQRHESVVIFARRRPVYHPQMQTGPLVAKRIGRKETERRQETVYGGKPANLALVKNDQYYPTTDLFFQCVRRAESIHPTQKPIDLLAYLVRTYTNPGAVVLDFCAGSFTTGVACVNEGRDFIGIERDPDYFAIGQRRTAEAQARLAGC